MLTPELFRAKWEHRLEEWGQLGVQVNGAKLAAEVLADVADLARSSADEVMTLDAAANESGYTADHLRHLVAAGTIPNAGAPGRPRIRRADLPKKATRARGGYDPDADALSLSNRRLARG